MNKIISKIIISFLLISCLPFLIVSCKKDTPTVNTVDQLFRPVLFTADISGNNVTFSWVPIKGATYSLEVSKDSLLFSNNLQVFPLDEVKVFTLGNLSINSRYSARIKAVSKDKTIKDSGYENITFMTLH